MSQIVLQPSANKGSRKHYRDTIDQPVDLSANRDLLGETLYNNLAGIFPSGHASMWGVAPGRGDRNRSSWERLELGATVLFTAGGRIFGRGIVAALFHNPRLARQLWGEDENGATWEFMYALDQVTNADVPYQEFNEVVDYKLNFTPQGFTVLNEEKSDAFLEAFPVPRGVSSGQRPPNLSRKRFATSTANLKERSRRGRGLNSRYYGKPFSAGQLRDNAPCVGV